MKKNIDRLKKELSQKVKGIKSILSQALVCELESDERIEFSNVIASSLRAILYGDRQNNFKSLVHRVGYDKRLLFPLYNYEAYANVIPTYNLLQFSINTAGIKVNILDELFKTGGMWETYLTFDSWLNEVVIDTKLKDVEPLSRLLVVKIVADTMGAHVDDNIERHIFEMSMHDLLPIVVVNGNVVSRDLEAKAKSIFCETILAIAKELVDAYEIWAGVSTKNMGPSNKKVIVQKYFTTNSKSNFESVKYDIISRNAPFQMNSYNSNSYYECELFTREVPKIEASRNGRRYVIILIDYKDVLEGEFLGKSLYC